ncbi:MAG: Rieske (2Fe-2S) protein [Rhabdochlamydiaceae bacterium]
MGSVKLIGVSELPSGTMRAVDVNCQSILLANIENEILAVSNVCTHEEAYLSEGSVRDHCVVCPLHSSEFDLRTGEALVPPALDPLKTFHVEVKDGSIFINI